MENIIVQALLSHPVLMTAGIMIGVSLLIIPLSVRYIITPLILFSVSRRYHSQKRPEDELWMEGESRKLADRMYRRIRSILYHSESFQLSADLKSLLGILIPAEEGEDVLESLRFDFSPVRFLETLLLAYEDLHLEAEKRILLRYLLKRRVKWFKPFQGGMKFQRMINSIPVVDFFNRKGLLSQGFRLVLIPLVGLPGILLYALRSIVIRGIWAGLIRYYYTCFLFRAAHYLIYLYGGNTIALTERCKKFSRREIIRKGLHYDRELSLLPDPSIKPETLTEMLDAYERIMSDAGFAHDPIYTLKEQPRNIGHGLRRQAKGLFRRTLSALNHQFTEKKESQGMRETALRLLLELPGKRYPGRKDPWMNYRIIQGLNVSYRLLMISLSRVYSNAPGSHFAMERVSVDLIRQAREFSRQPLVALLSRTGKNSYKTIKPLLRLRKLIRLRSRTTPMGVATLSMPLLGKLIQERWKELILYRLGRAIIRYSIFEEETRSLP